MLSVNGLQWGTGGAYEVKVTVGGIAYPMSRILSMQTQQGLFKDNTASIGGVNAGSIDLVLIGAQNDDIPKAAEIRPYVRRNNGEWLPAGVFYIDTRERDFVSGLLTLKGYDAMLKAEVRYDTRGDIGRWPRDDLRVARDIAALMGVQLDSETEALINKRYQIQYPVTSETGGDGYSCREILGFIAVMYSGNWTLTEEGKLRLVQLKRLPMIVRYLADEESNYILIGGVRILV